MLVILILAAVVSSISFTITYTSMFTFLREAVSKWGTKWEEWIFCPWCFSHWVTFIMMLVISLGGEYKPPVISGITMIDYLIVTFAIILFSGLGHFVLLRAYKPVAEMLVHRKIEKLKEAQRGSE